MHNNFPKPTGAKFALFQLTFLMLGCSLLVDSVNGFFLAGLGIDPKLSLMFKLLLLIIVLCQIGSYSTKALLGILLLTFVALIGPTIALTKTLDATGFIVDFTALLKSITPLIFFIYCVIICRFWPDLLQKYGKWCCISSFFVLLINIFLGALGYGFSSYVSGVGVKGFFYAGNEVSGLLIIFYGAILHLLWQKSRWLYMFFIPVAFITGLLIATKSALLSVILLIFAIPIFNERQRLLNLTWLKFTMIFPVIIIGVLAILTLIPILESVGIWSRLVWFYEKKGLLGIILSGRDIYLMTVMSAYQQFATFSDIIFGFGPFYLSSFSNGGVEIDPIDLYFWFGITGALLYLFITFLFLRTSYLATQQNKSLWGPCVLLINIILIGVSFIAGHIFTSGMLAPFIGVINGMAYADLYKNNQMIKKD